MKRILSLLLLTVLMSNSSLFAQLSGTKVIGVAPSDYTTFAAAVSALNSQGVNGNVIFNVKPGTYTERISINQISGANANKTITFKAQNNDSTSVILQYASSSSGTNNYVVQLNGADYVTFKNMTIKRTDTLAYSIVIDMKSGARRNTFANNIIQGNTKQTTSTFKTLVTSDNVGKDCFNTFNNNIFRNGDYGIYFLGQGANQPDSGNVVTNNKFIDQSYKALWFTSQLWLSVKGNTITTNSQNTNFNSLYAQYSTDSMRISKNRFISPAGFGIYLTNCNETGTQKGLISNNFISVGGTSTANGIYLSNTKHQDIFYNSINIYSTQTTNGVALNLAGSTTEDITVKNNCLANTGGGYAYFVASTIPTTGLQASDYNDIFTTGVYVGSWKATGNITNLANWKYASALDAHSVSANPNYTSQSDLHAHNGALNAAATPALAPVYITDDIDGNARHSTTPDIGADEFTTDDLGISNIVFNSTGYCPATNFNIALRIRNYSLYPFSGTIPVYYQINGSPVVNASTAVVNIAGSDSILYTFTTFQSLMVSGTYDVKAGTLISTDINNANDTTHRTLNILSLPPASAGSDQTICLGDSVTLTASGGVAYVWDVTPPNNTPSVIVSPLVPTSYSVTVSSAQGCIDSANVTVTPVNLPVPIASYTYIPAGLQISFTSTSTDATDYNWTFGDGASDATQNPVHNYPGSGNYTARLIASNLCASDTTSQLIGVVGMAENTADAGLNIGPNPATEILHLYNAPLGTYEIFSMQGLLMHKGSLISESIDIADLGSGIYFIRITNEKGQMFMGKFMKE